MFTGIVETLGRVEEIRAEGSNQTFLVHSPIGHELHVDQSLSHNGVCLTVTAVEKDRHWVTAVQETLAKTTLSQLKPGDPINLERCMLNNGRFDGHIVQGHVDQIGTCTGIADQQGSWIFDFQYDPSTGHVTVEKGSICVNGISLTCFDSKPGAFRVAIIPYTFTHTTFHALKVGDQVNLEFDIIGKYVQKLMGGTLSK